MDDNQLYINVISKDFLKEIAKWANFLSIVGFVMIGLFVIFAIFAGTVFSALGSMGGSMGAAGMAGGTFITILYLLMAVLYFFPIYYLNKFASNLKVALQQNNSETLATSLGFLKSHYKFIGIMMIVLLSIYALFFVIGLIGLAAAF